MTVLEGFGSGWVEWNSRDEEITLDGEFTAFQLREIANYMDANRKPLTPREIAEQKLAMEYLDKLYLDENGDLNAHGEEVLGHLVPERIRKKTP